MAALATLTGSAEFGDLALASLEPLRKVLQDLDAESQQKITEQMGIGSAIGLGSIVYSLVQIAQLLDEACLIEDAQQVACLMVLEDTAVTQESGVMTGVAGAILGLLALHKVTNDSVVLAQATAWGKHLLNTRVATDAGFRAWTTPNGILTGLSNGVSGIALARRSSSVGLSFGLFAERAII